MGGADGQEGKGERRTSPKGSLDMMVLVGRLSMLMLNYLGAAGSLVLI